MPSMIQLDRSIRRPREEDVEAPAALPRQALEIQVYQPPSYMDDDKISNVGQRTVLIETNMEV